jgi:hypothetical protein
MISDHIIATMTLDTIVAFVTPFEQEWSKFTVPLSRGYQRIDLMTSPLVLLSVAFQRFYACAYSLIMFNKLRNSSL